MTGADNILLSPILGPDGPWHKGYNAAKSVPLSGSGKAIPLGCGIIEYDWFARGG